MLSEEQNRRLTEVGAGTPMGELLRRYWMPIAAVAELDDAPTKPVRLIHEDLAPHVLTPSPRLRGGAEGMTFSPNS